MKRHLLLATLVIAFFATSLAAYAAGPGRQAEVARLGADVMPFSLAATTHVFTKTRDGGTQQVVAKNAADAEQIRLVREHLRELATRFEQGDFSGPSHIHGATMPGLAQLEAAKPGQVLVSYKDLRRGALLTFRSADPALVSAVHAWFDAQLSDHGPDAVAGHSHHHANGAKP